MRLGKIIDNTRCIGCHACSTACKQENDVAIGVDRTRVKYVEVGTFPNTRRHFQVTRCNQCDDAPCVSICPVTALYHRDDGIVDFDKERCIGCRACMAACPYDALYIDPTTRTAAKCNFCAHRVELGLQPACVVVCPEEAIIVGDLDDGESWVARRLAREQFAVRKPELGTQPKLFYKGGSHVALRPEAALRPEGDLFMWANQRPDPTIAAGAGSVATAVVAYDTGHVRPWGIDVALYMWTKSISAGALLVAAGAGLMGSPLRSRLMTVAAPLIALVFLIATLVLLVIDLEQPKKFYTILTRPQWRSWLVRGAAILAIFGIVDVAWLAPHAIETLGQWTRFLSYVAWPTVVVAGAAAAYTAFLLAQATGRELWSSPLGAPHLIVQAALAGAAALLFAAIPLVSKYDVVGRGDEHYVRRFFVAALMLHGLLMFFEVWRPHASPHLRRAVDSIVRGQYSQVFWLAGVAIGVVAPLVIVAVFTAPLAWGVAASLGLLGLFAWEYVWVFAGQSVPLS
jgi:Fe-S-cluster-containing dehydrogenase component/formate-dependent nitrite reductase membrane component NrfD